MKVTVVFDPDFGGRPANDLGEAFWLMQSPSNRKLAEKLWRQGGYDSNSAVFDGDASEDSVIQTLLNVTLHHPDWTVIDVCGAAWTDEISAAIPEVAGCSVTPTLAGFAITRAPANRTGP